MRGKREIRIIRVLLGLLGSVPTATDHEAAFLAHSSLNALLADKEVKTSVELIKLDCSGLMDDWKIPKRFYMTTAASDPFYVARDAVNQSIGDIQSSFKRWEKFLNDDSTSSKSFQESTKALLEDVDRLEEDLSVIDSSIRVVEANPARFPLRPGELDSRKQWSGAQHRVCGDIRSKLNGPQAKSKLEADRRKAALQEAEQSRLKKQSEKENDANLGTSKQVHQQIINQQDETLTELARVTDRLGQTAIVINSELQDQQRLLSELDRDIDRQSEKMNYVMGKMAKLLRTSDTKQLMLVIILMVISVILFMWNIGI